MSKNEILKIVIDSLIKQRADLNYELSHLNHNETSFVERKNTLEYMISNIDSQIGFRIMDITV